MSDIRVEKIDEACVRVLSDDFGLLQEINEKFKFLVPGHQWMPKFKSGIWDGYLSLFNIRNRTLPYGLLKELCVFCDARKYEVQIDSSILDKPVKTPSPEVLEKFIASLSLSGSKGEKIEPHDYQIEGVIHALSNYRSILQSPTASGKSLMIYLSCRYFMEQSDQKILIVVPTTSLVSQMYGDFDDYSKNDDSFLVDESTVHTIMGGREKNSDAPITVSTWQSIYKQPRSWFAKFGMIIGDECHQYKAACLSSIMEKLSNAWIRIGTTGTIPDNSPVGKLQLQGHFGPIYQVTTTKKLMDRDAIAQLKIKNLVLKYPEDICKYSKKLDYKQEIDFLCGHKRRNAFIRNLALDLKGNTLVMFNFVEKHGKPLYEDISSHAAEDRKIFYVAGSVETEEREDIRRIVENEKNAIIVASSGVFAQGVNIKNLHNIIFAAPVKSQIRVLQSIGRGLRKSENGRGTTLYDIIDDLSYRKHKNFALRHGIERAKIYRKEQFSLKTHMISL